MKRYGPRLGRGSGHDEDLERHMRILAAARKTGRPWRRSDPLLAPLADRTRTEWWADTDAVSYAD